MLRPERHPPRHMKAPKKDMWGFPKIRSTILGVNKDYSILGSISVSPYFGKLPCSQARNFFGGIPTLPGVGCDEILVSWTRRNDMGFLTVTLSLGTPVVPFYPLCGGLLIKTEQ